MINNVTYSIVQRNRILYIFLSAVLFQLFLLLWLYIAFNHFRDISMNPMVIGRRGVVIVSFSELAFFLFFIPLSLFLLHSRNNGWGQSNTAAMLPFLQGIKKKEVMKTVTIIVPLILTVVVPAGYLFMWQVPIDTLFHLTLTLIVTGVFISSLFHFTYSLLRDSFAAVTATFLILFSLVGGVILINPVIEWAGGSEPVIWSTLMFNPLIAISSSIDLDILRTDPLYYLSLISTYEFHYPGLVQHWLFYGFVSLALFTIKIKMREKLMT